MSISTTVILSNGLPMPRLGLGVWRMKAGTETSESVKTALQAGYRLVDAAALYGNEEDVRSGIRESGVSREEIFLTTKVWNDRQGYDSTLQAFDESLQRLGTDYADLYLIHWPVAGRTADTWRALERLYAEGRAKAIGVSNFLPWHLQELEKNMTIRPMLNQIELHPLNTQELTRTYCRREGIAVEAYSPLARAGALFGEPVMKNIAAKHGKTPAQVALRWAIQDDVIVIPKSVHADRIRENADIFSFSLDEQELKAISALNRNERTGSRSFTFDEHESVVL